MDELNLVASRKTTYLPSTETSVSRAMAWYSEPIGQLTIGDHKDQEPNLDDWGHSQEKVMRKSREIHEKVIEKVMRR